MMNTTPYSSSDSFDNSLHDDNHQQEMILLDPAAELVDYSTTINCSSDLEFDDIKFVGSILGLSLVSLSVVAGNSLVIIAVLITPRLRSRIHSLLITSLAVADLCLGLLVLPFSAVTAALSERWIFGNFWCQMWLALDVWLCTASIYNLMAISLDRYIAIVWPLRYPIIMTPTKGRLLIGATWLLSFVIASPNTIIGWPTAFSRDEEQFCQCTPLGNSSGYIVYSAMGSFYLPMFLIAFMYLRIYMVARSATAKNRIITCTSSNNLGTATASGPPFVTKNGNASHASNNNGVGGKWSLANNGHFGLTNNNSAGGGGGGGQMLSRKKASYAGSSVYNNGVYGSEGLRIHRANKASQVLPTLTLNGGPATTSPSSSRRPDHRSTSLYNVIVNSNTTATAKNSNNNSGNSTSSNGSIAVGGHNLRLARFKLSHPLQSVDEARMLSNDLVCNADSENAISASTMGITDSSPSFLTTKCSPNASKEAQHSNAVGGSSRHQRGVDGDSEQCSKVTIWKKISSLEDTSSIGGNSTNGAVAVNNTSSIGVGGERRTSGVAQFASTIFRNTGTAGTFWKNVRLNNRLSSEIKAAKTVGIVTGCFIFCWLGFSVIYLIQVFPGCSLGNCVSASVFGLFFWLGYTNSVLNPFIYALFNRDFRRSFRSILTCSHGKQQRGVATTVQTRLGQRPSSMVAKNHHQLLLNGRKSESLSHNPAIMLNNNNATDYVKRASLSITKKSTNEKDDCSVRSPSPKLTLCHNDEQLEECESERQQMLLNDNESLDGGGGGEPPPPLQPGDGGASAPTQVDSCRESSPILQYSSGVSVPITTNSRSSSLINEIGNFVAEDDTCKCSETAAPVVLMEDNGGLQETTEKIITSILSMQDCALSSPNIDNHPIATSRPSTSSVTVICSEKIPMVVVDIPIPYHTPQSSSSSFSDPPFVKQPPEFPRYPKAFCDPSYLEKLATPTAVKGGKENGEYQLQQQPAAIDESLSDTTDFFVSPSAASSNNKFDDETIIGHCPIPNDGRGFVDRMKLSMTAGCVLPVVSSKKEEDSESSGDLPKQSHCLKSNSFDDDNTETTPPPTSIMTQSLFGSLLEGRRFYDGFTGSTPGRRRVFVGTPTLIRSTCIDSPSPHRFPSSGGSSKILVKPTAEDCGNKKTAAIIYSTNSRSSSSVWLNDGMKDKSDYCCDDVSNQMSISTANLILLNGSTSSSNSNSLNDSLSIYV